ncbi:hypothetical protein [Stakelama pacifica]|uniref:Inner membrane protein n=1 Tax=Stakelama pacifica TaxID=517720 RepID=A0A4R6FUZ8_9SPHN|nr:hypothetical protein [Stakelama pacifica]TDN85653.1 hypothetical protein EV664_102361 [Stakelama pacifica]
MDNGQAHDGVNIPRKSSARMLLLVGLIAFLAGIAAMGLGYALWGNRFDFGGRKETAAPAAIRSATSPDPQRLNALAEREAMLSTRIDQLEERLSGIDSDSRTASGFATRAEGLMVAFAARRALDRGLPLGYIEGQLRERFGAVRPKAVTIVVRAARSPVTLEDLRLALDAMAPQLMNGNEDAGWWAATRRELSNLIVVRHERTPSPRATDRLARARRMLDAGNVDGALAEVSHMPGADDAASWMTAAKRYIEARRALDAIETTALEGGAQPLPQPEPAAPDAQQGAQDDAPAITNQN